MGLNLWSLVSVTISNTAEPSKPLKHGPLGVHRVHGELLKLGIDIG
jgi:hypothetical protein